MWKYHSQKLVVRADNLMVTIDCPPQILVVSDNRKGLISNAAIWKKSNSDGGYKKIICLEPPFLLKFVFNPPPHPPGKKIKLALKLAHTPPPPPFRPAPPQP